MAADTGVRLSPAGLRHALANAGRADCSAFQANDGDNRMMSEDSQIVVPASFVALYLTPDRSRPTARRADIAERHEFCEDLAQMLTEEARLKLWELGVTEADVLARVHLGLLAHGAPLSQAEAGWVVCRLAELLGWEMPLPRSGHGPEGGS